MSIAAWIFWGAALATLLSPPVVAIFLFMGVAAFGALAVVPPDVSGGANVLPQSVAAIVLAIRIFSQRRKRAIIFKAAKDIRGFGLECAFVAFALLAALTLPHIFADRVTIMGLRGEGAGAQLLEPSISNLAQSAYLVLNLIAGLSIFAYFVDDETGDRRELVLLATLTGSIIFAISGLIDSASVFIPELKEFVLSLKTVKYQVFADTTVLNVHRITGFFPEAAAFAGPAASLGGLLYFIRPAFRSKIARNIICPLTSLVLISLAALSTSTTAYLGLGVFGLLVVARLIRRVVATGTIRGLGFDAALALLFAAMLIAVLVFAPEATRTPVAVLNQMVFQKSHTGSYSERSYWNSVAMQAFLDTYGLGVGPGGARTSDWLVALLSNTGVLGFALMMGFIGVAYLQRPVERSMGWIQLHAGVKYGFLVFLATQVASGTTIDPGLLLATNMALMIGCSARATEYFPRRLPDHLSAARRRGPQTLASADLRSTAEPRR